MSPQVNKHRLGLQGEALVAAEMKHKGWTIAGQRLRCAAGEADLFALQGRSGWVVEVKTSWGRPAQADRLPWRRQQHLWRVAETLLWDFDLDRVQVSLVLVSLASHRQRLRWITLDPF
ncbi:MAG TPA: hypothetical protein DCQ06_13735 [Myxococcales bacterium]|nr:hypothetical protein [Myxococcales bacterium]HAN32651.1 hypothetical protein [Myxococcales bacterium]